MRAPPKLARFRAPANVLLRRAQITLMLATLLPTVLMLALGIVLLAVGQESVNLVAGLLLLAFCTTSLTGYILGSMLVSRGASMARVQNDFLSTVSHELRTPLTSIRMFMETLGDERLTDPAAKDECLRLLQREVNRLDDLVSRVIELSRLETGRHPFEMQPVRLQEVVQDALQAFRAATISAPTEVALSVPEVDFVADRSAVALALSNLLVNAHKYSPPEDRQIRLFASADAKEVVISVADSGPGVPRDEQKLIFEEFQRGEAAVNGRAPGSGLGLSIVRAVAKAHKGSVELYSRPGAGAEFRLRLRRNLARTTG
jgi:two-component system phosphate regulon sensor histidine kinase PhoR